MKQLLEDEKIKQLNHAEDLENLDLAIGEMAKRRKWMEGKADEYAEMVKKQMDEAYRLQMAALTSRDMKPVELAKLLMDLNQKLKNKREDQLEGFNLEFKKDDGYLHPNAVEATEKLISAIEGGKAK